MVQSIYLAGKIRGRDDWRFGVVKGLEDVEAWLDAEWPRLGRAIANSLDYVGPFAACTCGHHCGFCAASLTEIHRRCLKAVAEADIFFAWLDNLTAHGTLIELGHAAALRPRPTIVVAVPDDVLPNPEAMAVHQYESARLSLSEELWFATETADIVLHGLPSAELAVLEVVDQMGCAWPAFDSPIEEEFWKAYVDDPISPLPGLVAQHEVLGGRYRLDFAIPRLKVGIELDGYEYHSTREAFLKDRQRQRHLEALGWRLIRFAGVEVKKDPRACVRQADAIVRGWFPR